MLNVKISAWTIVILLIIIVALIFLWGNARNEVHGYESKVRQLNDSIMGQHNLYRDSLSFYRIGFFKTKDSLRTQDSIHVKETGLLKQRYERGVKINRNSTVGELGLAIEGSVRKARSIPR